MSDTITHYVCKGHLSDCGHKHESFFDAHKCLGEYLKTVESCRGDRWVFASIVSGGHVILAKVVEHDSKN